MQTTYYNFKTKEALVEAVRNNEQPKIKYQDKLFPDHNKKTMTVEGPHYPFATWYAVVKVKNGRIVKVLH